MKKLWEINLQGTLASKIIQKDDLLFFCTFGRIKARGGWTGWGNMYEVSFNAVSLNTGKEEWTYVDCSLDSIGISISPAPLGFYVAYPDSLSESYRFLYLDKQRNMINEWNVDNVTQISIGMDRLFVETDEESSLFTLPEKELVWSRNSWDKYYYPLSMTGPLFMLKDLKTGERRAVLMDSPQGCVKWEISPSIPLDSSARAVVKEGFYYVVQPGKNGGLIILDREQGKEIDKINLELSYSGDISCFGDFLLLSGIGQKQILVIHREHLGSPKEIVLEDLPEKGPFLLNEDVFCYTKGQCLTIARLDEI